MRKSHPLTIYKDSLQGTRVWPAVSEKTPMNLMMFSLDESVAGYVKNSLPGNLANCFLHFHLAVSMDRGGGVKNLWQFFFGGKMKHG